MPEFLGVVLAWAVPAVIVFGVTAVAVLAIGWAIRRSRRSPRAQEAADVAQRDAGAALVRLDDAVSDLDVEVGLSGALYSGTAPGSLRRARITAQHVRDQQFEEFRDLSDSDLVPSERSRRALRITNQAEQALAQIDRARDEHNEWIGQNVSAAQQVSAAQSRLARVRAAIGDPQALVTELSDRFDPSEWEDAARAAAAGSEALEQAENLLRAAEAAAKDPSQTVLPDLAAAEKLLRDAEADAQVLEQSHRAATQAAQALPGEFEAARAALRQAMSLRSELEPDQAEQLGTELREFDTELASLSEGAVRRPTATVAGIARLRDRLDLALGDARTAQQRLRGARTALPGTLTSARNALARAENSVAHVRAGANARVRLALAHDELARAQASDDPVAALDAGRRAIRAAEDAQALADYEKLGRA